MPCLDDVDLLPLAKALQRLFGGALEAGYLDGRTRLRDAVAAELDCSDLEAEALVDTLEARGFVRFPRLPDATHLRAELRWTIHVNPR
jgi:hypothetical protein